MSSSSFSTDSICCFQRQVIRFRRVVREHRLQTPIPGLHGRELFVQQLLLAFQILTFATGCEDGFQGDLEQEVITAFLHFPARFGLARGRADKAVVAEVDGHLFDIAPQDFPVLFRAQNSAFLPLHGQQPEDRIRQGSVRPAGSPLRS
jgi:hypothetical protein